MSRKVEQSVGVILPQTTATEMAGASRSEAATPQATREPGELELGLLRVRNRREWFGQLTGPESKSFELVQPELTQGSDRKSVV